MSKLTYINVIQDSQFRKLLCANITNRFGDAIDTIAFSWLGYAFTGEEVWAAAIFERQINYLLLYYYQ